MDVILVRGVVPEPISWALPLDPRPHFILSYRYSLSYVSSTDEVGVIHQIKGWTRQDRGEGEDVGQVFNQGWYLPESIISVSVT